MKNLSKIQEEKKTVLTEEKVCCNFFQIFKRLTGIEQIMMIQSLLLLLFAIYVVCIYCYLLFIKNSTKIGTTVVSTTIYEMIISCFQFIYTIPRKIT